MVKLTGQNKGNESKKCPTTPEHDAGQNNRSVEVHVRSVRQVNWLGLGWLNHDYRCLGRIMCLDSRGVEPVGGRVSWLKICRLSCWLIFHVARLNE